MKLLNLGCGRRYHPDWINLDLVTSGPCILTHDLRCRLPFPDTEFNAVYHSHLLEHLSKRHVPFFLHECYRVLQLGGIMRVVVPDLEQIVRLYLTFLEKALEGDDQSEKRYEWILLELFDQMVRIQPGGEMLRYWKQNPMPAEDFVIERLGSEVLTALTILRSENAEPKSLDDNEPDDQRIGRFRLSGEVHQWMYDRYSLKALLQSTGFQKIRVCRADESDIPDFNSYLLDIEADGSVRKPDSLFMEARKTNL